MKRSDSKLDNSDTMQKEDEKSSDPEVLPLSYSGETTPDKILKIAFALFLFIVAIGSGFVAKITRHILIWHINPPSDTDSSKINSFGGLLIHNCTSCSSGINITCKGETNMIDEKWIWALFLVIVAPYCLTFLSTLFRICFKTNKSLNWKVLAMVLIIETMSSVGVSVLAFLVLPHFDPASASVLYLAVGTMPPVFDLVDKVIGNVGTNHPLINNNSQMTTKSAIVFQLLGLMLQIAGIISIGFYITFGPLFGLFVVASVFVSMKYWENFITIGNKRLCFLRWVKLELQKGRTKVTCITSIWKIIVTFLSVIVIFTARKDSSLTGFKSLFGEGQSTLTGIYGVKQIGDDPTCQSRIPLIAAIVNILCDYICYKATKTACVIFCQRFGFSLPIVLLPLATTLTLVGLMNKPDILKLDSCDLFFSEWCLRGIVGLEENSLELIIAFILLYISVIILTIHVWKVNGYRHGETARIFVSPFYCGLFLDLSMLFNRRRNDKEYDYVVGSTQDDLENTPKRKMLYACCATMWHETPVEMTQLLKSLFRLDMKQYTNNLIDEQLKASGKEDADNEIETFDFEAHVFFDDAFDKKKDGEEYADVNRYVKDFINVINDAGSIVHGKQIILSDGDFYKTPYGGRIHWKLPGGNILVVHLKNKEKIRHKKRWSQVMYMFYILKWKLENTYNKSDIQAAAENTYLLALDGDVDFEPEAVLSLMRRMNKSRVVGAACGRIHPIGSGPMVWYQQFEYAVSHWLQKATEHVIGCVLCSPGCFSLFRGSAILHPDVLDTYTTVATEAKHFVQYDQGEDRWLCTLLLKRGWKVEYCAESDSYTFAPEGFYEFYNQRRRWSPSTMANILDLILDWKKVTKTNENISFLYIVYHVFLFVSSILTPGTIFMLILGAIIVGFESIPPWLALVLNLIPVGVFLLLCLYASSQIQLQFAAVLSAIYAIVMVIVMIGVVKDAIEEGLCSMTTIFLLFVAGVFVVSAILHPKEFFCLLPGLLYFVAIPSMSMLMFLYSIGNLHVVSWGTRESKPQTETKAAKSKFQPEKEEKGYFCSLGKFISCMFCPTNTYTKEDFLYSNMLREINNVVEKDELTHQDQQHEEDSTQSKATDKENVHDQPKTTPKRLKNDKDSEFHLYAEQTAEISKKERKFWEKTIKKHLYPLEKDEEKEKEVQEQLIDLRNRVCLFVYLLNAILVTIMYGLTQVNSFKDVLSIEFTCGGKSVSVVPISLLFLAVFGLLLLLQFLCMLYHRFSTLVHITASTDIWESDKSKMANMNLKVAEYLTSPADPTPATSPVATDKHKDILEINKTIVRKNEKSFQQLEDVVKEKMKIISDATNDKQGSLYVRHHALATKVMEQWANLAKNKWQKAAFALVKGVREKQTYNSLRPQTPAPRQNQVAPIEEQANEEESSSSPASSHESISRTVAEEDSDNDNSKPEVASDSNV